MIRTSLAVRRRRKPIKQSVPLDTDKVRQLREQLNLTQDEAAKLAGFPSRQRWYEIESGARKNIRLETLEAVARALGAKAKDLLK